MYPLREKRGFTLIELLVVIAIIAILAAILFPVFMRAKDASRVSNCQGNLKQINSALLMYVDDWGGRLPSISYYCRLFDIVQRQRKLGPYQQDLLGKYIKSKDVWFCKSLKPEMKLPKEPRQALPYALYTWKENGGSRQPYLDWYSNYMWIHSITKGNIAYLISGKPTSICKKPSKAVTFMEMPYWMGMDGNSAAPHGGGAIVNFVNYCFYDGHIGRLTGGTHGWAEACNMGGWY